MWEIRRNLFGGGIEIASGKSSLSELLVMRQNEFEKKQKVSEEIGNTSLCPHLQGSEQV